jgi:bifunctional non-homologous end joining protein LigD
MNEILEVDGHAIEISHPDRVLFPRDGITKRQLCDYYARVAPVMLPHVYGRIVSMHRFPEGLDGERFFQKNVSSSWPEWIRTVKVHKEGGELTQVVIDQAATLVYLAEQACITPHVWLSRADTRERPDRLILDLDPSGAAGFEGVRWAARAVRELFEQVELVPFVMTTGSRGLHVVAPLTTEAEFDEVHGIARGLASLLAERHPERLTVEQRKAKRGDRIFLDYLRNGYAQTAVAAYAVRAREGAPVATPIDWREVGSVEARTYRLGNLFRRLAQREDPWQEIGASARPIEKAAAHLGTARPHGRAHR